MRADQAINIQQETIQQAIRLLQTALNETIAVDLDKATWTDVSKFAHVADAAQCVVERLKN